MVPKATSGDYRALYNATIPDRHPVPHLGDFAGALFGKEIPVAPEDITKITVTTPFGLLELTRMSFGLRNVAQTFQSQNAEEHKENLALVLDHLDKYDVVINPLKYVFDMPSLEFLGHRVGSGGLRPLSSKVEVNRDFPPPTCKRRLQRFLSVVNFYHRSLPNCADLMLPRTNMFLVRKFTHPAPQALLSLMVDPWTIALDAVLQQHLTDSTRPLAFFSTKLSADGTRHSIFGRKLLAIYLTVKHFRNFLEGRDLTIFTDDNPLTFAIRAHSNKYNSRKTAHLDYISQATTDIRHIDGTKNGVANMLSRPPISAFHLSNGIDPCAMANEQRRVGCLDDESISGLQRVDVPLTTGTGTILCDVSCPFHRPFVSASMRRAVFKTLHGLSDPRTRASQKLPAERFVWPVMNKDVKARTRSCLNCQRNQVQRHKSPPGTFPSPDARFSHVHLDVVGLWWAAIMAGLASLFKSSLPQGHSPLAASRSRRAVRLRLEHNRVLTVSRLPIRHFNAPPLETSKISHWDTTPRQMQHTLTGHHLSLAHEPTKVAATSA
ncbi:hypothetical protein SprV_0301207700 [Sparganum proliferum]